MIKRVLPPLVLLFLAPAISQLLSAELAPASFFSPFGLTVLPLIYGGGAILVRDQVKRWRKGWVALLLLGAVYGLIREGLMLRSFFDPFWQGIEFMSYYGRWAGINWVWSIDRTIYHSVVSVGIPVLLTEIMFPEFRNKVWLGKWVAIVLAIVFAMNIIFGYFFGTDYEAGVLQYWLTAVFAAVLFFLSWKLPVESAPAKETSVKPPVVFWLTGFMGTIGFIVIFWTLPNTSTPPAVTVLLGIVLTGFFTWLLMRLSGNMSAWDDRHRLALASGPLTIFILLTPMEELFRSQVGSTTGMMLVGLGALILLVWLHWRTIRRSREGQNE